MAARRNPEGPARPPQAECGAATLLRDCRCRPAVERAFCGMLSSGSSERAALDVACRVYRFHHPEVPAAQARDVVHIWVYRGRLH